LGHKVFKDDYTEVLHQNQENITRDIESIKMKV